MVAWKVGETRNDGYGHVSAPHKHRTRDSAQYHNCLFQLTLGSLVVVVTVDITVGQRHVTGAIVIRAHLVV